MSKPQQQNIEKSQQNNENKQKLTQEELEKKWNQRILTESGLTKEQFYENITKLQSEVDTKNKEGEQKFLDHENLKKIQSAKSKEHRYKYEIEDQKIPIDGDFVAGSQIFTTQCQSCHSLEKDNAGRKTSGPGLGLIYGRRAGADYYYNYTPALTYSSHIWNTRNLFYFLQNPKNFIKGCKCEIKNGGIQSEEERSDLVAFLKIFTKEFSENLRIKAVKTYGADYININAETEDLLQKEKTRRNQKK
ncbi:hypothetical protein IMG5_007220 [Ichthyophthirius multifiliis]|uniref:Cytochrome c domain-containing protein n=1 Tax=Ichthyophthirius multifiliis TaxID=5932 RepID=G0QJP0_ICHMU|nr:hypothetical protein IMG5_007220 [Ichthyophthirius multifiliis]EGR34562.1 hypothetical protein IMG5_007220 [Ichthyophthirius multifiliis]|eukprot:XP_004039866.1 hypothetical protein IMG5_007220 [Ichthyophthirius multifiliis]